MNVENTRVNFGIRPKLFLFVLISFSLLMAIIIWRIEVEAEQITSESIQQQLQRSSVIVRSDQENRYRTIQETAISLARDGRILPRVFEEDSETLQDLTGELQEALEFDILIFTNERGEIIARSDKPSAIGRSLQGRSSLFDTALSGKEAHGIMLSKGQLLQIVAVPIFDNVALDIIRGTIALAYQLSPQRARDINQLTDSEIGFFTLNKNKKTGLSEPINTFFTAPNLAAPVTDYLVKNSQLWKNLMENQSESLKITFTIDQERFHGILYPLIRNGGGTLGFVITLKSRTELLQPFKSIQKQVLVVGSICLFIASLFAWLIAHRITRPIFSLVSVANRIQMGDYPEPDAKFYQKSDEVGLLYRAIIKMGKTLKDKVELENYLSQVSISLDGEKLQQTELQELVEQSTIKNLIDKSDAELNIDELSQSLDRTTLIIDNTNLNLEDVAQNLLSKDEFTEKSEPLTLGSCFAGRYEILKLIGKGSIGSVQLVNDLDLNEEVALKIFFNRNLQGDELNRFKEEIRLARRITHRNIVRTFDFGVWQNRYYITMEYIYGFDLNNLIQNRGKLSPEIAIIMGRQICSAIIAAHNEGIIHRDLKPTNIIINKQGVLKIMDFGLAIQIKTPFSAGLQSDDSHESITGIAGTPRYMAPEQFEGTELDVRTDIYAIGGILYFILSGESPFNGKSYAELSELHRFSPSPHISKLVDNVPTGLDAIIYKALEKDKDSRFQTVTEFHNALMSVN